MHAPRRTLGVALAVASVFALAGCIALPGPRVTVVPTRGAVTPVPSPSWETLAPTPAPTATVSPTSAPDALCVNGKAVLAGNDVVFSLTGDCADVTIAGNRIVVQMDGSADTVLLQGSNNDVAIGDMGDVRIEGNDNSFVSGVIGSMQIAGDRMRIDADGAIGDITVNGNDNTFSASGYGTIQDNGGRNVFG